mmetsp:Transcript_46174/g.86131  ORF Transcript_46174/g.86131 Transcript_46174/m.86131 type:complete len:130 (-) Transcript_46174:1974-2363(-)
MSNHICIRRQEFDIEVTGKGHNSTLFRVRSLVNNQAGQFSVSFGISVLLLSITLSRSYSAAATLRLIPGKELGLCARFQPGEQYPQRVYTWHGIHLPLGLQLALCGHWSGAAVQRLHQLRPGGALPRMK